MFERLNGWSSYGRFISAIIFLLTSSISLIQCNQQSAELNLPKEVDFNYDVKPILVQNCYLCHGPDPSSRKADLRLDTYEGATALRESGKAIHPGNADRSELIRRITHEDPGQVMPPPESNLVLDEYQIAVLKKWIDQGAEWKPHWSFIPPEFKEPEKLGKGLSANAVDDFIMQKIDFNSLKPAPLADENTLLRRVSYVLTGLPPTLEEIEDFTNDDSPEAYEKMVDHYLDSPAFGERWARHWMDIVRYAETQGHEFDYGILGAWRYRDYLIRAFNEDVPYDQLTKEHIAGDMMETVRWNKQDGTNESQLGTAFYTLGEGKHSPVDIKEEEVDRIDNMIDVTSKAFQALTVSCAKCHDHKFDPIPTKDFYALYGVMESSRFTPKSADITYEKLQDVRKLEQLKKELKSLVSERWKDQIKTNEVALEADPYKSTSGSDTEMLGDFRGNDLDGWKSDGLAFGNTTTSGDLLLDRSNRISGIDDGKASSSKISTGIFGSLRSPNFTITKDFIGIKVAGKNATIRIIMDNFQLIRNPIYGGLQKYVDNEEWSEVIFDLSAWKGHKAYIEIFPGKYVNNMLDRYTLPDDAYVEVRYALAYNDTWPEDVPVREQDTEVSSDLMDKWLSDKLNPAEIEFLNSQIKQGAVETQFTGVGLLQEEYREIAKNVKDSSFFMGITEGFGIDSHVFIRGSHTKLSEEKVPRGFLSVLSPDTTARITSGSGRMELAEAIIDPDNPLTARVMVNRIWHHLFGKGIVETVDNFGLQGKLPTHPDLLDYLAIKFQKDGWSIKNMIKFIVMSNTFRRAISPEGDAMSRDPENLYLSHYPVRRLEAEAIRDGLLFAGGNLDLTLFGPPEPVYLTEFMTGRGRPGKSGAIDGNGRRTIYLEVRRNFLQPMLLTFDRPIPFTTFGNRNVTNVPAQSLILMNDPFVKHQAELMAKKVLDEKELGTEDRIKQVYLRTLSRLPREEELENAKDFIRQLELTYELEGAEASENPDVWKDFCHSIFNLKEFIYLI